MKTLLDVGNLAPDFSLVGTDGLIYAINQYKGYRAIVLFFTSNGCPYAKGMEGYLKGLVGEFYKKGVAFIGINSSDDYDSMVAFMAERGLPWRYLHDPTQQIAKRYGAIVTPHFFLFDHHRMLIYSGRALDSPKAPERSKREDLKEALTELLDLRPITISETGPIGCSIRWQDEPAESEELLLV